MDAADVFRQGLGSVIPRPPPPYYSGPRKPAASAPFAQPRSTTHKDPAPGVAHTLTACCRCRQRKTRCDATLPRCVPCDRAGATCEYYDTAKGRRINRIYVVELQNKVRQLEAELGQYTDDVRDYPDINEEMVRPGGLVRLDETDETSRYLGPSSGIAMTRLVMEEAKRYSATYRIADLIPELHERRRLQQDRMQSISRTTASISGPAGRKKSYPMISAVPASTLPTRQAADGLVNVYIKRAQFFAPTLHEVLFLQDVDAVYNNDKDPYKNFVVRMIMAISLQKLQSDYMGLADSLYQAAMQHFEGVVRPKDLKTLQCLVLIGQYSLLTPTRTALYYVVGLATRICQQLGIGEEKTIALGAGDALTLDMRRRLSWIVATNEFGLAHIMGRPNGFAKGNDSMDVQFFAAVDDEYITAEGIQPAPQQSEKKMVAIHFCKMRLLQAEIRRVLYEKKRPKANQQLDAWLLEMKRKLDEWRDSSPATPEWCVPWFTGRYHSMLIVLYRPSPQVPKPTSHAATICFDGAHYIINLSNEQMKRRSVDLTWVFLLTIYMSLNTILWSISYPEVRARHSREEVDQLYKIALDIIDQSVERWPGSASASQLYSVLAKACMQSYDWKEEPSTAASGPPTGGVSSPGSKMPVPPVPVGASALRPPAQSLPLFSQSPFASHAFDSSAAHMSNAGDAADWGHVFSFAPSHNNFRSGSIFLNPGTDLNGRRPSNFPPDFNLASLATGGGEESISSETATGNNEGAFPSGSRPYNNSSTTHPVTTRLATQLPTPPESLAPPSANPSNRSLSPTLTVTGHKTASPTPTPTMSYASPAQASLQSSPSPVPNLKYETVDPVQTQMHPQWKQQRPGMPPPRNPVLIPPPPQSIASHQQRAPVPAIHDWFKPPPPFISPHAAFSGGMGNGSGGGDGGFWGTGDENFLPNPFSGISGLGLGNGSEGYTLGGERGGPENNAYNGDAFGLFPGGGGFPSQYSFVPPGRQGSLSQAQQLELMDMLDKEGMSDINSLLNAGMGLGGSSIENWS
ncbi:fungal-specific transcription factor domain-containing protein [Diplogelasinospora grovesii]|uniref:Fungal-specific transcription factor domain-containing protein n=1 Tax=Diplogelasinospora grovesii TaxID=303347 RepID=A0AAN6S323_9PEZI|nr:fungal-specific transcription factor domain-containing protein [Diplogelasinospora grovesii]